MDNQKPKVWDNSMASQLIGMCASRKWPVTLSGPPFESHDFCYSFVDQGVIIENVLPNGDVIMRNPFNKPNSPHTLWIIGGMTIIGLGFPIVFVELMVKIYNQ